MTMKKMERRTFLKSAATVSAFTVLKPATVFGTQANSTIRMGIIGCGGRGTAVISSMAQNTSASVIAMADLFEDKLQSAYPELNKLNTAKGLSEIPKTNLHHGSGGYQALLNNKEVDAVLVSSPCYSHPGYVEAALAAGKHVYSEKPVAVDVAGCQQVMRLGEVVKGNLSLAIGFQIRFATPYVEMVKRIHQGDLGEMINAQLYYLSGGIPNKPYPDRSFDEQKIRNQYHFHALSGGILLDQGIHMLDVCNWALKAHPVKATGSGGKKAGPEFGDAWTNYQIIYEYPDELNVSFHGTQFGAQSGGVCARFIGTKGIAEAHYSGGVFIQGEKPWDSGIPRCKDTVLTAGQKAAGIFLSSLQDADSNKDINFIKSIESGNYINEALSGSESTLSAILGRTAATAGKEITWEEMMFSNARLDPMLDLSQFDK
ncbi:MAG: Gfo/Idh/MocA family oxidoreductase [Bacteroidia bacterium]|nr:Gfo/Idh/MocA family oxidoreductase [Bacteroidia bacterium]